jgi:hypothetical protein
MPVFPYEILKLIIDQVECSHTLFELCLVSSWIRQIAEPLLYKTFTHADCRETEEDHKYRRWQLRSFVRTLIRRPDHAFRVENVNLGYWDDDDDWDLPGTAPQNYGQYVETSEGGFGIFVEALEATGLFMDSPLADILRKGTEEPLMVLILALCPNVQVFTAKSAAFADYLPHALEDMKNGVLSTYRPGNASKIRMVSLGRGEPNSQMCADYLDPYWDLPNIDTIHATNIYEESPFGEALQGFSPVKNLSLEYSTISDSKLVEILTTPVALKTLKLNWTNFSYGAVEFSGPALGEGLFYQKHSLRELEVFDRYGLMAHCKLLDYRDSPEGGHGLLPRFEGTTQEAIFESSPVIEFIEDDTVDEVIYINGEGKNINDDLKYFNSGEGYPESARFKIGSLSDFPCLERVSLPSVYFLGLNFDEYLDLPTDFLRLTDVLPKSLISLNLQNPHHAWVFLEVKILLQEKETRTPKLRKVELTVSLSPRHLWEPLAKARLSSRSRTKLQQLAIENQVELFIDPLL